MKDLLHSYPKGVEMRLVYTLFLNKFSHAIKLQKLGFQTAREFFDKHSDTFSVKERSGSTIIYLKEICGNGDSIPGESFKSCSPSRPELQQPKLFERKKLNIYQDSPQGPELISSIISSASYTQVQKMQDYQPPQTSDGSICGLEKSMLKCSIK